MAHQSLPEIWGVVILHGVGRDLKRPCMPKQFIRCERQLVKRNPAEGNNDGEKVETEKKSSDGKKSMRVRAILKMSTLSSAR